MYHQGFPNRGVTRSELCFIYLFIYLIYLFLAALGLRCCARAFSSCGERGLLFIAVHGFLIAVASLVAEHGLQVRGLQQLWLTGSRVQAQQLWLTGLVVPWHVGSSQTRARTRVPCIGRQILNHCATREVPRSVFQKDNSRTIFESNPSCWSLPRGPVSPNKTKKHNQGSKDLFKNIPTPATTPMKLTFAPAWQISASGGTYSKEEVLKSVDQGLPW